MADTPLQIRFGAVDADKIISALDRIEKSVTGMASKTDEEAKKVDNTFSDLGNKMAKGVATIGVAVAAAASTAAIGIWKIVSSSSDMISELDKMSQKTGISIADLQGLQYAAKMADVDVGEFSNGLKFLAKNAADAATGIGPAATAFASLGIKVTDLHGKLKPTDQLLLEVADKFSKLKDGPAKIGIALDIMGRSGTEMIPILNKGSAGLTEYTSKFKDLGVVIGGDLLAKNEEFERVTKNLSTALTGIKLTLASELFPIVTKYIDKIDEWVAANKQLLAADVGGALDKIAKALPSAESMISLLNDAVKALKFVAENINGIITTAKLLAEIMTTIWVTSKLNSYATALETFATGMQTSGVKSLVLKAILEDIGWVLTKGIPIIAAFVVGWEIGKAINEWAGLSKIVDKAVSDREKYGDLSVKAAATESATVEMLNQKYNQHFKSLAEWNTYLDEKKKESAADHIAVVTKETQDELKLKNQLTADEIKEIQKYIEDEKKERGDAFDKLDTAYKQDLTKYGKTAEGKAAVDEKYFYLYEALMLENEKKTAKIEQEESDIKAKNNAARFANAQEWLQKQDQAKANFIQKQIDADVAEGNILVDNTDEYLGRIYKLDNISQEDRQKLLDNALAIQKTKYENFVNDLNTVLSKVQEVAVGIKMMLEGNIMDGLQKVLSQLGPYGQLASTGIGLVRTFVSWMDDGQEKMQKLWEEGTNRIREMSIGLSSAYESFSGSLGFNVQRAIKPIEDLFKYGPISDPVNVVKKMQSFTDAVTGIGEAVKEGTVNFVRARDAIQGLIDRAAALSESIGGKIVGGVITGGEISDIRRQFMTPEQLSTQYNYDITSLKNAYAQARSDAERLDILSALKDATDKKYQNDLNMAKTAEDQTKAQTEAITALTWIQTESGKVQENEENLLKTLSNQFDEFIKQMGDTKDLLQKQIDSGLKYDFASYQALLNILAGANKTLGGAMSNAGAVAGVKMYQHGGPVDMPGFVNPAHDAFVITHEMLNRIGVPKVTMPTFSIPAPNVTVNVPSQKGGGQNIQISGTFLPGDVKRIIDEIGYDQARTGSGRTQNFNRQQYGGGKINMRVS